MSKLFIFVVILFTGVAIFMAGAFLGLYYFKNNSGLLTSNCSNNLGNAGNSQNTDLICSSKSVSVIQITGTVTSINGREITINTGEDALFAVVLDGANVLYDNKVKDIFEEKDFIDIKVGSNISMSTKLVSGKFQCFSVLINAL